MIDRAERGERAVILHPVFRQSSPGELDEFSELARSAGVTVVAVVSAPRQRPDARYYVGKGKIEKDGKVVEEADPFYKNLTAAETAPAKAGKISWNFEKFLIGKNGEVVARFAPRTAPDAPDVVKAIEAELAK